MTTAQTLSSAVEHHQHGRFQKAEALYREVLAREPRNPDALHLLGVLAHQAGHNKAAADLIRQALTVNPNSAPYHVNLGVVLAALHQPENGADACRRALEIDASSVEALINLGSALQTLGRPQEALEFLQKAVRLQPNRVEALANLGNALNDLTRFDEAVVAYQRALTLTPNSAEIHNNLGVSLRGMGRLEDAISAYERALSIDPNHAGAHWNHAINLLLKGDFAAGWEEFEWRLRSSNSGLNRNLPQPQWNGSDISSQTILLHAEGGFGDALQFVRYAPLVRSRAGRVILECQPELAPLLSTMTGIDVVIARGTPLPPFDCQIPLQSLPHLFRTTLENIPATVPYLSAPPESAQYWKGRLGQGPAVKVGLVWTGSNTRNDRRSRTLNVFDSLAEIPGVEFYSLQKNADASDLAASKLELIDYTSELANFADAAGLLQNLDLLISVDTSVAHLAGALAKPVWTLIPFSCDFRWLLDREDSPWYPTMRLFRQKTIGDWKEAVDRMAIALSEFRPAATI